MYAPQHAPNPVLSRSLVACAVALTINDEMCTAYDAHRIHMWYFVRRTQSISIRFVVGPAASQAKDTEAPCHAQWWETALARLHPQGYRCGIHESVTLTALRVVHGGRESWKPSSGGIGVVFDHDNHEAVQGHRTKTAILGKFQHGEAAPSPCPEPDCEPVAYKLFG